MSSIRLLSLAIIVILSLCLPACSSGGGGDGDGDGGGGNVDGGGDAPALGASIADFPGGGGRLINHEGFESGGVGPFWKDTEVDGRHYSPNTNQTPIVGSPVNTGSLAANYYVLAGTDERIPVSVGNLQFTPETDEIYIEWHEYFERGFPWARSSQKLLRISHLDGNGERDGVESTVVVESEIAQFE